MEKEETKTRIHLGVEVKECTLPSTLAELQKIVKSIFSGSLMPGYKFFYFDEEKDLISVISEEDYKEALVGASGNKHLELYISDSAEKVSLEAMMDVADGSIYPQAKEKPQEKPQEESKLEESKKDAEKQSSSNSYTIVDKPEIESDKHSGNMSMNEKPNEEIIPDPGIIHVSGKVEKVDPESEEDDLPCFSCDGKGVSKKGVPCSKCLGTGKMSEKWKEKISIIVGRAIGKQFQAEVEKQASKILQSVRIEDIAKSIRLPYDAAQTRNCTECNADITNQTRYACGQCLNYWLCEKCENTVSHDHPLVKYRSNVSIAKSNLNIKETSTKPPQTKVELVEKKDKVIIDEKVKSAPNNNPPATAQSVYKQREEVKKAPATSVRFAMELPVLKPVPNTQVKEQKKVEVKAPIPTPPPIKQAVADTPIKKQPTVSKPIENIIPEVKVVEKVIVPAPLIIAPAINIAVPEVDEKKILMDVMEDAKSVIVSEPISKKSTEKEAKLIFDISSEAKSVLCPRLDDNIAIANKEEEKKKAPCYKIRFEDESTIEKDFHPGEETKKIWTFKNDGKIAWPENTELVPIGDNIFRAQAVKFPQVFPGKMCEVEAKIFAPSKPGKYKQMFEMRADGKQLGKRVWAEINVVPKEEDEIKPVEAELKVEEAPLPEKKETVAQRVAEKVEEEKVGNQEIIAEQPKEEEVKRVLYVPRDMNTRLSPEERLQILKNEMTVGPEYEKNLMFLMDVSEEDALWLFDLLLLNRNKIERVKAIVLEA